MRRLATLTAALLLPVAALSSCSGGDDDADTLTVLAASSLTSAFEQLADDFEADHDGVEVTFSFGSSTALAEQAAQGAPGDVLATADEVSMGVAEAGDALEGEAVAFATNQMVLAVPAENPAGIESYADLEGTDWVRCADDVPCGRVALSLLDANEPIGEPVSLEVDAKSVLGKVTSGEADAGFVYATDAAAAGDAVTVIEIPGANQALTTYFIAVLDDAENDDLAADWVELVTSETGQAALAAAEFTLP